MEKCEGGKLRVENNCTFIGRNTKDIEFRMIPSSGKGVSRCTIAVDNPFNKEKPLFLDYVSFGKSAETIANYSAKGKLIALSGNLTLEQWQDNQGNNRSKHVLVVESFKIIEWKDKGENTYTPPTQRQEQPQSQSQDDFCGFQAIDGDSEIPF